MNINESPDNFYLLTNTNDSSWPKIKAFDFPRMAAEAAGVVDIVSVGIEIPVSSFLYPKTAVGE